MQASHKSVLANFSFNTVFNKVDLPTPVFPKIIILNDDISFLIFSSFEFDILSSMNSLTIFGNFSFLTIFKIKSSFIFSKDIFLLINSFILSFISSLIKFLFFSK